MQRDEFARRLAKATKRVLAQTRKIAFEYIPDATSFALVIPPWDAPVPLEPRDRVYADDPQRFPDPPRQRLTPAEFVEALWREGLAPRWIDLVVVGVESGRAVIRAEASPRFTDDPALLDNPHNEDSPFVLKTLGPPPWVDWTPQTGPLERFSLTWRDDPEAARRAHAARTVGGRGSPRRRELRRLLAGPRSRDAFLEIFGVIRNRPAPSLPWRDAAEVEEAIDEAERALADWDDRLREAALALAFAGGREVHRWSRLIRYLLVANVTDQGWSAAMRSPWLAGLVSVEVRRSEVDLIALARSPHVRGLKRLVIHKTAVVDADHAALIGSPNLAGLTHLTLSHLHLPPERLAAWLDGTPGRSLRELALHGFPGAGHLDVLLARPALLARLQRLELHEGWLRDPEIHRLAACTALAGLRVLDLGARRGEVSPAAAAALRAAPTFARATIVLEV